MSYTGKYFNFLSEGFEGIGNFAFSPCNWALKGFDDQHVDSDNYGGAIIDLGFCCACGCLECCCKMPAAFLGVLITLPLAGTAAVIWGARA